jgi:KDO2-lipid IV(A) lauroyltransferase
VPADAKAKPVPLAKESPLREAKSNPLVSLFAYGFLGAVLLLSYFLQAIGLRLLNRAGACLGTLLYFLGFRKKIVTANLQLALGKEKSPPQLLTLTKQIYRHTGITFLEIARNFSLSRDKMAAELILSASDAELVHEILGRGKGGVFISGHMGNWELLAMGMKSKGFPVAMVVKKMNNPFAQILIERQRLRTGIEVIYSGRTIEKMKAALGRGAAIGFMVDQNTTGKKGIRANFFGIPASSIRGLSGLVKESGTYVIPFCAVREKNGRNRVRFLPELKYLECPNLPENSPERIAREEWLNTQQYQQAIETMVRENPAQWLWIHRRWKADRSPLSADSAHLENMQN